MYNLTLFFDETVQIDGQNSNEIEISFPVGPEENYIERAKEERNDIKDRNPEAKIYLSVLRNVTNNTYFHRFSIFAQLNMDFRTTDP